MYMLRYTSVQPTYLFEVLTEIHGKSWHDPPLLNMITYSETSPGRPILMSRKTGLLRQLVSPDTHTGSACMDFNGSKYFSPMGLKCCFFSPTGWSFWRGWFHTGSRYSNTSVNANHCLNEIPTLTLFLHYHLQQLATIRSKHVACLCISDTQTLSLPIVCSL